VVLAKALARSGTGCIYSLDHKAKYAQKTSQQIKLQGISPYASVHHTPLAELNSAGKNQRWYDMNLNEIIKNKIDLLIIDGPPGIPGENNREPGLYEAAPLMAESISILVDDIHREDEKSMIKRWTQDNPKFKKEEIAGDNQAILLTKTKTSE
ncbi:MAG: class I SAM-dependent methyltransferase, partial [Clostridiales bacterium]|nr:class I SAM-dependent methyltransferase [Clostridiales bacterium]